MLHKATQKWGDINFFPKAALREIDLGNASGIL